MNSLPRTRRLKIVAQDPSIRSDDGKILMAEVDIPAEEFAPGPVGYRVQIVDYDSSTDTHYMPLSYPPLQNGKHKDPFEKIKTDEEILDDPNFHAQNVYAIIMRTLARFEFALGRRISWGFGGHQINVAPHAFADANAFYSERDCALMFGYFRSPTSADGKVVFSSLSHDVVAHETTHAILDGLRERYTTPSSPEQAGFHEGFADIVALLSVFSLRNIVGFLLKKSVNAKSKTESSAIDSAAIVENSDLIAKTRVSKEELKESMLFGLAKEMGAEMSGVRGQALRRSLELKPLVGDAKPYLKQPAFEEPHRCGELLVAALLNAFIEVWNERLEQLKKHNSGDFLNLNLVVENGAEAAEHLLTMAIRALDYTPPTDIKFGDFLSAILTADKETVPDDTKYNYRAKITQSFKVFGIEPASNELDGAWQSIENDFKYDRTHFESLMRDQTEVFRFIWDNRAKLHLDDRAYTKVQSVRPCLRIAPDGFILRETVAEYIQMTKVRADELQQLFPPIGKPAKMQKDIEITLYGGGTIIFDEYGKIKYHIANHIFSQTLQADRIDYLWRYGYFPELSSRENQFAKMHLNRSAVFSNHFVEEEF